MTFHISRRLIMRVTFRGRRSLCTALREILIDSRSAKCCIFPYKMRLQDGTSKVSEAAGAR